MDTMKLGLVFQLLFFRLRILADSSNLAADRQFPEDFKTLCPYTSFCGENASLPFPGTNEEVPCCQGCSCDPSCGLHSNCCYKYLDLFNIEETHKMTCQSTQSKTKSFSTSKHFRMINKCVHSTALNTDEIEVDYDSTYSPVYSNTTGFIYYNAAVASCNNANNAVPFRKAIQCSFQEDFMRDADRILTGLRPYADCHEEYLPPSGVELKSEECKPNIIRTCNVTGTIKEWKPFWQYCESFNATFVFHRGFHEYIYANIYCFMCNEQFDDDQFGKFDHKCSREFDKIMVEDYSLTVILTPGFPLNENTDDRSSISRKCPPNEVIVNSFTKSCRPIKCPVWKIMLRGRCEFYSKRWIGESFAVTMRVKAASNETKIPRAFFEDMPQNIRNDKLAKWLKRKVMKRWELVTFYHLSADNVSVAYLLIEAKCQFTSVSPEYIEHTIKRTLVEPWYINDKKKIIPLNIIIDEGQTYLGRYVTLDDKNYVSLNSTDVTDNFDFEYRLIKVGAPMSYNSANEYLYKLSDGLWEPLVEEILINNLFFCYQVDLLPDEYDDNGVTIFFKVTNVTLYNFRRLNTLSEIPASLFETDDEIPHIIRVCLSEFTEATNIGSSYYIIERNMILVVNAGIMAALILKIY